MVISFFYVKELVGRDVLKMLQRPAAGPFYFDVIDQFRLTDANFLTQWR